ncbi:hypothetical protein YPPY71_3024, partial [Yersinia pestis PY-71]
MLFTDARQMSKNL